MMYRVLVVLAMVTIFLTSCQNQQEYHKIDLDKTIHFRQLSGKEDSLYSAHRTLTIAIASIVSAKESYSLYSNLLNFLEKKLQTPIERIYTSKYQEVYDLFQQNKVNVAFVCCGLYSFGHRKNLMELLAVPVIQGKVSYQAYVITQKNSPIQTVEELLTHKLAISDELSFTGCLYLLYVRDGKLKKRENVIVSGSHDASIELVNKGIVEGASVDGLVFEDIARRFPERVKNIRIIEKSQPFGIPPVVVHTHTPADLKQRLQDAFLSIHQDSTGLKILKQIGIDKFELPNEEYYRSLYTILPDTIFP